MRCRLCPVSLLLLFLISNGPTTDGYKWTRYPQVGLTFPPHWRDNEGCSQVLPSAGAGVTQLVECDLAKVDVAGSNPVSRSIPAAPHQQCVFGSFPIDIPQKICQTPLYNPQEVACGKIDPRFFKARST